MKLFFHKYKKDIKVFGFFLFLLTVIFLPTLSGEYFYYTGDLQNSDLIDHHLPHNIVTAQYLKQGEVPLWTNDVGHGYPYLAEIQPAVFYPPNILLFSMLPAAVAQNWSLFLSFIMGGLFFYLFVRVIGISRQGALLGTISFSLSAIFVIRLQQVNIINVIIWLPLVLWLIEKHFRSRKKYFLLLLPVIGAIQVFAGHPQIAFYCFLLEFTYFFIRALIHLKQIGVGFKKKKRKWLGQLFKIFFIMLGWAVLILLITAIQILPTYELTQETSRQEGVIWEEASGWSFKLNHFINFIAPYFYGNPANADFQTKNLDDVIFWESSVYFSLIGLLLAIVGLFSLKRNRYAKIFFGFCIITLLLGLGKSTPIYYYFWLYFPGFNYFRFSSRFLIFSVFSLTVLVGLGWDRIRSWLKEILMIRKKDTGFVRYLFMVILLIIIIDLFIFASSYHQLMSTDSFVSTSQSAAWFSNQNIGQPYRVASIRPLDSWYLYYLDVGGWRGNYQAIINNREVLRADYNSIWDIESNGKNGAAFTFERKKFWEQFSDEMMGFSKEVINIEEQVKLNNYTKLAGLENVKYFLSYFPLESSRIELKKQIYFPNQFNPVNIYENKDWLSRIIISDQIKVTENDWLLLQYMLGEDFNPASEILLEKIVEPLIPGPDLEATFEFVEYEDKKIVINTSTNKESYLLLTNTYYPGWQADINGQQTEIIKADYLFQAVKLPAGQNTVTFSYHPQYYRWGKNITLSTLGIMILSCLGFVFISRYKGRKKLKNQDVT